MPYDRNLEHFQRSGFRRAFLDAAVEVQPELLVGLRAILPTVRRRWPRRKKGGALPVPPLPPEEPALPQIVEWARRFNLDGSTDMWIERAATFTLHLWRGGLGKNRIAVATTSLFMKEHPEPFRFSFEFKYPAKVRRETDIALLNPSLVPDFWDPHVQRWEHFRRQVREEALRALDAPLDVYRAETERRWWGPGGSAMPTKRELDHYRWTALHQVAGWSCTRIAKEKLRAEGKYVAVTRRRVKDGVRRTAKLLGLRRRPETESQIPSAPNRRGRVLKHK